MKYELTRIKTFIGREGQGLNAVIVCDGKPICFVNDDASGGEVDYDYRNPLQTPKSFQSTTAEMADKAERELGEYCLSILSAEERAEIEESIVAYRKFSPELKEDLKRRSDAIEAWVNKTIDDREAKKQLDRAAKKKTLFRIKGENYGEGEYRTIKAPYSPEVQKFLDKKYPGQVTEIYGVSAAA